MNWSYVGMETGRYVAPDSMVALSAVFFMYMKFEQHASALRIGLLLDDKMDGGSYVKSVFAATNDLSLKRQFAHMVARYGLSMVSGDEMNVDYNEKNSLQKIVNNTILTEGYLTLARDIEVMEPKSPEDIYKVHLISGDAKRPYFDSARQNMAATFVNAFVNAGFCQDKLMTGPSDSFEKLVLKNDDLGRTTAAASLGMIHMWDSDSGLAQLNKYLRKDDSYVVAGALLGIGIASCGVKNDSDTTLDLISKYISTDASIVRTGAILGLGISYAGSRKDKLKALLSHILSDCRTNLEELVLSAVSLGLVFVGSCNEEIAESVLSVLRGCSKEDLAEPITRLLPVAVGLLYLGKQERATTIVEVSLTFDETIKSYCATTIMSLAFAGTGNVNMVQHLLRICSHQGGAHRGPAVLGIALVALAEDLEGEMTVRSLDHLLSYGDHTIRRAVPLALAILSISNPKVNVINTLKRLSEDTDIFVSMGAIISLGLISAGTNNARVARFLRELSSQPDDDHLFCVRIAQGLVHLGKGLITLDPCHSDGLLLSPVALGGLVVVLHTCLNLQATILGEYPYMMYILAVAMQPRMLLTVDEDLKPLLVPVRVGQAVDVAGQVGQPRIITGFRTHNTPMVLAAGERAELATEKYIPLAPVLEGFVILRKNPEYSED